MLSLISQSGGARKRRSRSRSNRRSTRRRSSNRRRSTSRRSGSNRRRKSTRRSTSSTKRMYTLVNENGYPIIQTKYSASNPKEALKIIVSKNIGSSILPISSTRTVLNLGELSGNSYKVRKYVVNPSGIYKWMSATVNDNGISSYNRLNWLNAGTPRSLWSPFGNVIHHHLRGNSDSRFSGMDARIQALEKRGQGNLLSGLQTINTVPVENPNIAQSNFGNPLNKDNLPFHMRNDVNKKYKHHSL